MRSAIKRAVLLTGVAAAIVVVAPRPAAATTVCSLATAGTTCTFGTGLFFTDEQHPTGTGYIDSFLRIQQNGYEQGYNTSARPLQAGIDDKVDPNFTRDLALANVGIKNIGGVDYREFFLDVNEAASSGKAYITLDQLEIFGSNSKKLNNYTNSGDNNASGALSGATKLYDMDTALVDNAITLNYNLSGSGSGSSDMVFYLPNSLFAGYTYVTLYSQLGNIDGSAKKYASDAGFEEWFTKSSIPVPSTAVPEPSTLLLLGTGAGFFLRRRKKSL